MPELTFVTLHDDANRGSHGGGRLFRNYVAPYLALPSGDTQLCVVEIALTANVYAWVRQFVAAIWSSRRSIAGLSVESCHARPAENE